jgi:hypothetical protein
MKTPFDLLKRKRQKPPPPQQPPQDGDEETIVRQFVEYNQRLASRPTCPNRKCSCLSVLNMDMDDEKTKEVGGIDPLLYHRAVAYYQIYFGRLSTEEQKRIVIGWMRDGRFEGYHKFPSKFSIPFILHHIPYDQYALFDRLHKSVLCASSILDLLGRGKLWWTSCRDHARNDTTPQHALRGQTSNAKRKFDETFGSSLKEHFHTTQHYTWSRRKRYAHYGTTRGWTVLTDKNGNFTKRPIPNQQQLPIPSWGGYSNFYKHMMATAGRGGSGDRGGGRGNDDDDGGYHGGP